jgi:signal transduction histidine kinase
MIEKVLDETRPLLDELMRLAHPEDGAVASVDVAVLLREFHDQASRVLPSGITLGLDSPESLPPVLLNGSGLAHALWNLIINAKQAISGDGRIDLRAGSDRHQVWVEVADTGSGIPKEVRERIFDPYFTTKPKGQGTGLGLTAVARFVRGSNGLVQVDSMPGQGTTFRLRFPTAVGSGTEAKSAG